VTSTSTGALLGVDPARTADWYRTVWLPAWNSRDADAVIATLTPDAVFRDTAWTRPFVGAQEWRTPMAHLWTAFPDLTFDLVDAPMLSISEPKAAFHYRGRGTMTGPLGRHPATGRPLDFEAIEVLGFRGDLVSRWWGVADMADHYRQIGVQR
jgi:steroid delta-isomerase-like uncharacterized protein